MNEPAEDLTAVVHRHEVMKRYSGTNKTLGILLGFCIAICPTITGYYAYNQSKIESRKESHEEASKGYVELARPLEEVRDAIKILNWRMTKLEEEHQAVMSKPSDIKPIPLDTRALDVQIPKTLDEAAKK